MSANNHDNGDPNNFRYVKQPVLTDAEINKGRYIKIYAMAHCNSLNDFMKWVEKEYTIGKNPHA